MKTLIIIPAKNEGLKIHGIVAEIVNLNYHVLVVDDGSGDNTADLARQAGAKILIHKINRGQGAALKTGLEYALLNNYEAAVFFDADGQMLAGEIKDLIEPLLLGKYEVVLGSRFLGQAKNAPILKLITLKLGLIFTKFATGLKLTDVHNGFQAWSAAALKKINLTQDRQAYASELLQEIADKKLKYTEVPVTILYTAYSKQKGQSILNVFKILWDLIVKR
ncbi:glycosyltransferase family 2 protein [Candidatus Falkowbacteria bacterium]|nr:glycosyltransferase family 2 protein [Candidatus Falkowbacteria bacterium]